MDNRRWRHLNIDRHLADQASIDKDWDALAQNDNPTTKLLSYYVNSPSLSDEPPLYS